MQVENSEDFQEIREVNEQGDSKDQMQGDLLEILQENSKETMQEHFLDSFQWAILECPLMW